MSDGKDGRLFGRVALLLLTLYALAMIAPDLLRVVRPLGSFGLTVNGDGLIYDVQGPFESEEIRLRGRRACAPETGSILPRCAARPRHNVCASMLSQWGGVNYVMPGRKATFVLASARRPGPRSQAHG